MASLQHDFDYDNLPQYAIKPSPTSGQILALGYLMILKRIYYESRTDRADMEELVDMRLCHLWRVGNPQVVGWQISSRLLQEWMPYQRYVSEWHRCSKLLISARPWPVDALSLEDTKAFMDFMVQECGRGLAANWTRWKKEDSRHAQ
jgi:hypothetical protein